MKQKFFIILSLLACIFALPSCGTKGLQFKGFKAFQLQPISFTTSELHFQIGVYNPNKFTIKVKQVQSSIILAGQALNHYRLADTTLLLPPRANYYLPVSLTVSNSLLINNMASLLSGDSLTYTVSGSVKAGRNIFITHLPFHHSGKLSKKDLNLGF